MRRVELFEIIRKDHEILGLPIREIARKRGVHRRVVRQALQSAIPPDRQPARRNRPVMTEEVRSFIDQILEKDKTAPRKQRHTARRIWQRVTEDPKLQCTAAEVTVRCYVRERKRELAIGVRAFVPQHHEPGAQFEGVCPRFG